MLETQTKESPAQGIITEQGKISILNGREYRVPQDIPPEGKKVYAKEWREDFTLVVTAFNDSVVVNLYTNEALQQSPKGACPMPYEFLVVDRETLQVNASAGAQESSSVEEWLESLDVL